MTKHLPRHRPPLSDRHADAGLLSWFRARLWPGVVGCALLGGLGGFMILGCTSASTSGFTLFMWLVLGCCWGIPCAGLIVLWRITVQQHRQRRIDLQTLAAAIHHSQPDLYGESDFRKFPEELHELAGAVNNLETHYRRSVHIIQRDLHALRAQYTNLQRLFNSASVLIFGLERTGRLRLMNLTAEQLTSYTQPELENDEVWYETLFPVPACQEGRNLFSRFQRGESLPGVFDAAMLSRTGRRYIIQWFCSENFQAEADVTYSLVGIDVTSERERALTAHTTMTHLEQVIRQTRPGVASLTLDGHFHEVNPALCEFLGTTADALLTQTYRDIVHSDDAERDIAAFARLPNTDQALYQNISRYLRADGVMVYGKLTASVLGQHENSALLLTIDDISPYKQAEERLQTLIIAQEQQAHKQQRQLESAHTELQEFVSIASHDLKTPLRGISRLAYWLAQEYGAATDERGQEMTNMLISRVRRLDKLIDGLLEYSRVGQQLSPPVPIDLRSFIHQLLMTLPVPDHIEIAVSPTLPIVLAHPDNMRRVFRNLLNNAIQFLDKPAGSIAVTCETATGESADNFWVFKVRDNGSGIDPKYHQKIFHVFETLNAKDLSENTGIGLALVKKIITNYGGEIWVESTPGAGSTFAFTLPKPDPALVKNIKESHDGGLTSWTDEATS